jgi:geranylgeranyl transferase type-2 subunit alpha
LDDESLLISAQLLFTNPDFYTLWNYRREIILSIKHKLVNQSFESEHNNQNNSQIINQTNDEIICDKSNENLDSFQKLCENELQLTANCLKVNPKSYCVWHQRSWIIECMPFPNLQLEISLCNQFLELDERNCESTLNTLQYLL